MRPKQICDNHKVHQTSLRGWLGALLFLTLWAMPVVAQAWTEPVKIDGNLYLAARKAVAVGETLYVIGADSPRAYFICSRDNGQTWSTPVIPVDTSLLIELPDFKYSKGNLHLVWMERTFYPQIWHSRSSDGGRSWSRRTRIFVNSTSRMAAYPALATNGDTLFLTCVVYDTNNIDHQYLYFESLDAGATWQDSAAIEQGPLMVGQPPYLLFSQNRLHFVHPMAVDVDSFGFEIYYKMSTDFGLTWSDRIILSPAEFYPNFVASQLPSADADSSGRILVAWMDYANGSMCGVSGDIFYRVSLDNGDTWQPYGSLTNTQSGEDSYCLIAGDKFHVAWNDDWLLGCSFVKEAYSSSSDSGVTWQPREFISGVVAQAEMGPRLAVTEQGPDTVLHCFFMRLAYNNNTGLYYMRDHEFVGISDPGVPNIPEALSLNAYPNPFNSQVSFNFTIPGEWGSLEIFNVQGQRVKRIRLQERQGRVTWDSKNEKGGEVATGVYYVTLKLGGLQKTIQITLVR